MADRAKARLVHVESLVYGTPLAVSRQRLDVICAVLRQRAGDEVDLAALDAATSSRADSVDEVVITAAGIGVVPLMATFVKRAGMMGALSGLQSYADAGASIRNLVDNPRVGAILLRIDSPGGQVAGMFELASQIRAATKVKPVWAIADESALSAAYLLAAAAERVFVPSTGWLGSIGAIAVRHDETAADAAAGRRPIFVASGAQKTDGNPHVVPTDKELARLQAKVNQMGELFASTVATYRGLPVAAVSEMEAGTFIGDEAVKAGLADDARTLGLSRETDNGCATFEEVLAALSAHIAPPTRRLGASAPDRPKNSEQRRPPMEGETNVIQIADHQKAVDAARADGAAAAQQAAAERADEVSTLCVLAGHPEKIGEFLASTTPIADIRAWAKETRAKASEALLGVSGVHPSGVPAAPGDANSLAGLDIAAINAAHAKLATAARSHGVTA